MFTAGAGSSSGRKVAAFLASLGALTLIACSGAVEEEPFAPSADPEMTAVSAANLCVSAGRVETGERALEAHGGAMQAAVNGGASRKAEVAFDYLASNPDLEAEQQGEGVARRQIGLTLRAKDACNVVYVMWRLAPTPGVFVSVKYNPGKSRAEECLPTGCLGVSPRATKETPGVTAGQPHTLRAELDGDSLRVLADSVAVWEGSLPREAQSFDGPVGVRSDNAAYAFELRAPAADAMAAAGAACATEETEL